MVSSWTTILQNVRYFGILVLVNMIAIECRIAMFCSNEPCLMRRGAFSALAAARSVLGARKRGS